MKLKCFLTSLALLGLASTLFASENILHEEAIEEVENINDRCVLPRASAFAMRADAVVNINGTQGGEGIYIGCNRMKISGLLNLDAKYANHTPLTVIPGFLNGGKKDAYINNANLLFDLNVNRYIHAHLGLAYLDEDYNKFFSEYDRYVNRGFATFSNNLGLDELYLSVRDFDQHPFFLKMGRYFLPFGDQRQEPYPLIRSLPQLLTQARDTAFEGGLVTGDGIYSSILVSHRTDDSRNIYQYHLSNSLGINNFVARLGATNTRGELDFNVSSSFIWDVRSVQLIEDQYSPYIYTNNFQRAAGISGHADVTFGQVILAGDIVGITRPLVNWNKATRPIAYGITGGYFFNMFDYESVARISYQGTRHAADLIVNPVSTDGRLCIGAPLNPAFGCSASAGLPAFPKWRVKTDFAIAVNSNLNLNFECSYDRAYRDLFNLQAKGTYTIAARISLSV